MIIFFIVQSWYNNYKKGRWETYQKPPASLTQKPTIMKNHYLCLKRAILKPPVTTTPLLNGIYPKPIKPRPDA